MALKFPVKRPAPPKSPEELFQLLRNRDPRIRNLWSQQADMLRSYEKEIDKPDVAMELPTGSGKTLIALLIAEFRRQTRMERVVYLCPTKQLAKQVGLQAAAYDIPAVVLVGPQSDYDPKGFGDFATASSIAITTYSGLFNTNPKLDNAQCLLLDDAHASEDYIASLWTVSFRREVHESSYNAILDIFADDLPESLLHALREDSPTSHERSAVGKVLQPHFWRKLGPLRDALGVATSGTKLEYPWSMLREHLDACNLYLSWDEIVLRPFTPPSQTHLPFWGAKQRIYLSATLGDGGDLERIIGVQKITRLPAPRGWDRRNPGRRLILLPNLSMGDVAAEGVAAQLAKLTPRTLILCPDRRTAEEVGAALEEQHVDKPVLHATDIEDTLDRFVRTQSILLLTNRYDGLDLPDDLCRSLIIAGLPTATNLQERFLSDRLGAAAVLQDRVRTRVSQALGRCTRNDTDYAVIVMLGESLAATIADSEFRSGMNPETQVELELGIENSKDTDSSAMFSAAKSFLEKAAVRREVEAHVLALRDETVRGSDEAAAVLGVTAFDELNYLYAAWRGEWRRAFECAKKVCDNLEGGRGVRPYQALWYYFAASAAERVAKLEKDSVVHQTGADLIDRAMSCSADISWFAALRGATGPESGRAENDMDVLAIESAARHLSSMGHVGRRFDRRMAELLEQLSSAEPKPFERGLEALGRMLGFQAVKPPGDDATPDCVWDLDRRLFIAFEAKNGEAPEKPIPVKDVRQTKGHLDWVRNDRKPPEAARLIPVLATRQGAIDKTARTFTSGVKYISAADLLLLGKDAVAGFRTVRTDAGSSGEETVRARLAKKMNELRLLPSQLEERFAELGDLPPPPPAKKK